MMDSFNFNIEPASLKSNNSDHGYIHSLYHKYWDELRRFCEEMRAVRKNMLEQGFAADFSDREAEILYLVLRELKPDVVVEISPCHGYSTSYILTALTDNKRGKLYSFEILEEVNGLPLSDVIQKNLSSHADRSRLELRIGDAMAASIPDCDFVFIDSSHEAYFASWYLSNLIHKPKLVFVHDILIFDKRIKSLVPKAAFLSVREQCYVLESLSINKQNCFSVAEFDYHMDGSLKEMLPVRYAGEPAERSIVFQGHLQNESAKRLHTTQALIEDTRKLILLGFRERALKQIADIVKSDSCLFSKLEALNLLPQMGYRYPIYEDMFPHFKVDYHNLTVSELVLLLELALTSCNISFMQEIIRQARKSQVRSETYRYLARNYSSMAHPSYLNWRRVVTRLKRFPGIARIGRSARQVFFRNSPIMKPARPRNCNTE